MSDQFECPDCGKIHVIRDLELWEVYESEGKETGFICECEKDLIITSSVTGWTFDVEVNE